MSRSDNSVHLSKNKKPVILIISRCSWTLLNFRRSLILDLLGRGYEVHTAGYDLRHAEDELKKLGALHHSLGPLNASRSILGRTLYFFKVIRILRRCNYSLVHLFTMQPVLLGSLSCRLCGSPFVITVTGLGHLFLRGSKRQSVLIKFLVKNATNYAKRSIFQNDDDPAYLDEIGFLGKRANIAIVRGSGVDVNIYKPIAPSMKLRRVNAPIKFIMVSRLIREKGVLEFCDAISMLPNEIKARAEFTLVGDVDNNNPTAISYEEIRDITGRAGVKTISHQREVLPLLQSSDVVVLPSHREGMSMALLEGCAVGLAAITNDVPGCREIVKNEETGLLVQPHDAPELSSAIKRLILHPHLIPIWGDAGRLHVSKNFANNVIFDAISEIYQDVVKSS